jgi:hypothetical protein
MMEEYLGDIIVNEVAEAEIRAKAAEFIRNFMIDVKRRTGSGQSSTGWHLEQFLTSPKHQILAWWQKLDNAASKYQKTPILILTKGDGRWFVVVAKKLWASIQTLRQIPTIHVFTSGSHLVVTEMGAFFECVSMASLMEARKCLAVDVASVNSNR